MQKKNKKNKKSENCKSQFFLDYLRLLTEVLRQWPCEEQTSREEGEREACKPLSCRHSAFQPPFSSTEAPLFFTPDSKIRPEQLLTPATHPCRVFSFHFFFFFFLAGGGVWGGVYKDGRHFKHNTFFYFHVSNEDRRSCRKKN